MPCNGDIGGGHVRRARKLGHTAARSSRSKIDRRWRAGPRRRRELHAARRGVQPRQRVPARRATLPRTGTMRDV